MSTLTMCHSSTLAVRAKQFSQVLALEILSFHGVGAAQSVSVGCQSKIRTTFKSWFWTHSVRSRSTAPRANSGSSLQ